MTLRLVFGRDDLQRVRVATAADPMWELVLSVHRAQAPQLASAHVPWRQELGRRLPDDGPGRDALTLLRALVPPRGNFPDALTPPRVTDFDAGLEALACTSATQLDADMRSVFRGRRAPVWARSLAVGDRTPLRELVAAARHGHRILIEPHWAEIRLTAAADRAVRLTHLTEHGIGHLLSNLPGVVHWDGTVLETRYPKNHTVRLNGRGLTLIPSYFCAGNPISMIDPDLPPVLVYPADHGADGLARMNLDLPPGLVSLLGRKRAESLRALATPRSTSQLADCLGVSVGTASKQATVLREAQLVTSVRRGSAVIHSLTQLGTALLTGRILGS